MIQPLLDGDCLIYEVAFGAEKVWGEDKESSPPFDLCIEMLHNKVNNICALVDATHPPIVYLTGKGNFRNNIAKRSPYKQRSAPKPFHFYNLRAYIKAAYDVRIVDGLEADDLMAIEQTSRPDETIICTIDKDLRQVTGWHYGWEKGNVSSFGPQSVQEYGWIKLSSDRKKIIGMGMKYFFTQILTGDVVDSVPGLPKCGAVAAFNLIEPTTTTREAIRAVYGAYRAFYGPCGAYKEMLEQGQLLYMTRKLKPDGSPYLWGQTK